MTGRDLYLIYRDAKAGASGSVPLTYDELPHPERLMWDQVLEDVRFRLIDEINEELKGS